MSIVEPENKERNFNALKRRIQLKHINSQDAQRVSTYIIIRVLLLFLSELGTQGIRLPILLITTLMMYLIDHSSVLCLQDKRVFHHLEEI